MQFLDFNGRKKLNKHNLHALCMIDKDLWIGTYGDGIQVLNAQTGKIKNYNTTNGLDENSIYSIFKDSQGQIWTGSMNGICQYDAQKQHFTPIKHLEALIIEIVEDAKGNLWIATQGKGLVGGVIVVFLYICLLIRVGRIAKKCDRTFPAFLIISIALLLVSQAIFNMMVAVGLAPVTGQPLPLISKGGTSTLINCAYIGMILSVSRYTAKLEEQRAHDAQITMQVETGNGNESTYSEAQSAAEPTAKMLNSDAEFE
jgi:hypothetical protein